MVLRQLRLVDVASTPVRSSLPAAPADPTRRIFDHWLAMTGRSPARCKLGPTRRAAINAALLLYEADALCLAIEGMAADEELADFERRRGWQADLEWLLRAEARIERFADVGERARALMAERDDAAARQAAMPPAAAESAHEDLAAAQAVADAQRARYVALLAELRGGARGG